MKFVVENRLNAMATAAAILLLGGCGSDSGSNVAAISPPPPAQVAQTCFELNGMTIPAASIGLPTAGAIVTSSLGSSARDDSAGVTGVAAVVVYCQVAGEINPVDASAPKIKFLVYLPENWNHKAMMFGGGGYDGTIVSGTGLFPQAHSTSRRRWRAVTPPLAAIPGTRPTNTALATAPLGRMTRH